MKEFSVTLANQPGQLATLARRLADAVLAQPVEAPVHVAAGGGSAAVQPLQIIGLVGAEQVLREAAPVAAETGMGLVVDKDSKTMRRIDLFGRQRTVRCSKRSRA